MAGVPCFNDTCSIVSGVDANGRVELTVQLDPSGGLVCNDGSGLALAAAQLSDLVTAGMPDRLALPSPGVVQFPFSITNLTGNTILVAADIRFSFIYTVSGVGGTSYADSYFSFDLTHNVLLDTVNTLAGGAFSNTVAGTSPPGGESDQRQYTAKTSSIFTLSPGIHSVILQTNRSAAGSGSVGSQAGTGGSNGIRMDARLGVIGLPFGNIAS